MTALFPARREPKHDRFAQQADDFTFACLTLPGSARRVAAGPNRPLTFFCIEISIMRRIPRCNISVQPYLHLLDDLCGNTIPGQVKGIGAGKSD
jgi:hypothetical protein